MIHVARKRGASSSCGEVVLGSRFLNVKLRRTSSAKLCADHSKREVGSKSNKVAKRGSLQRRRSLTDIVNMVGEELDHLFSNQEELHSSTAADRHTKPLQNQQNQEEDEYEGDCDPVKTEASLTELIETVGKELEYIIASPGLERNHSKHRDILRRCADEEVKKGQNASALTHLVSILEQEHFHDPPDVARKPSRIMSQQKRNQPRSTNRTDDRKVNKKITKEVKENYDLQDDDDGMTDEAMSLEATQERLQKELRLAEVEFLAYLKNDKLTRKKKDESDPTCGMAEKQQRSRNRTRRQRLHKRRLPVCRVNVRENV